MILGVGALGAYAVYRLLTTRPDSPETVPILRNGSMPGGLPSLPQNILTPTGALLRPNQWYRGRLESDRESRSDIADELRRSGFVDVQVYLTPDEAANAIPLSQALANPTSRSRWFQARWVGASGRRQLPAGVVLLWPGVSSLTPVAGYAARQARRTQFR